MFRKNNELSRIGKPQSVNSIDKFKKISKSGIINLDNNDELKAYIEDNYKVSIRGFDKISLDENKIIFSGIDDMLKKYPDIENSLSTVFYDEKIKENGLLRGANIHIGRTWVNYKTITHELSYVMDKQRSADSNFYYSKNVLFKAKKN